MVKNQPASARDTEDSDSVPGSGRSLGGGHGNSLQYSCLENSMVREFVCDQTCLGMMNMCLSGRNRLNWISCIKINQVCPS